MVSNDTLWNLDNAAQAAKDVQFWNSEYMKRKFMKEGNYNELKDLYAEFTYIWREYLKKFKKARFQVQSATPSPWVLASSKKTS